ncbi:MAG: acyltransferase [Lachnospiraceae bacterium]
MRQLLKKIAKIILKGKNYLKFIKIKDRSTRNVLLNANQGVRLQVGENSKLLLGKPCFYTDGLCNISVRNNAILSIGGGTYFNQNCIVVAREKILIGSNCMFGPNVYICDHDHFFNVEKIYREKYKTAPVEIGDGSWIGTGVVILKGTKIGKNCVVGAGCVVTGNVPDNTILVQKRSNTFIERR